MQEEILTECPICKTDALDAGWETAYETTPEGIKSWGEYRCNCCGYVYEKE